ncbi:MAG: hydroxymethylbilane synthase, partial [candidate division KSB1 bacterium]|nr:hydroxymethylbilane synthase [candidate division KSB1 bacterium]
MSRKILRLGTRRSDLALWQANHVRAKLLALYPQLEVELVKIDTRGDKVLNQPIPELGGKGLFTDEIDQQLRSGKIDLAVHSLKDLPVELPKGLALAAVCDRRWVHDVLIAPNHFTLKTLPSGSRVGTCSLRRTAQVKAFRRDLEILPLRGNVPTRLRKLENGDYEAIILAEAGVRRLGFEARIGEVISTEIMLPAPAQGALGIEIRADDVELQNMLARLNDDIAAAETACERSLLQALGAGCQVPVAALARVNDGKLRCEALVASVDGESVVRDFIAGAAAEAVALGKKLAQSLWRNGADKI